MPDITMCPKHNNNCLHKNNCYRYTAPQSQMQSFFYSPPVLPTGECDHFMPNDVSPKRIIKVGDEVEITLKGIVHGHTLDCTYYYISIGELIINTKLFDKPVIEVPESKVFDFPTPEDFGIYKGGDNMKKKDKKKGCK